MPPTDAHARQEAHDREADRVRHEAGRRREQAEQQDADHDHQAPPDAVGHGAEDDVAEHHAEQRRADHEAGLRGVHAHLFHDGGQGDAGHRQVIAVEDDDHGAPEEHQAMEAVEFGLVGQFVDVDLPHGLSPLISFF
jgi:hypothetical protein